MCCGFGRTPGYNQCVLGKPEVVYPRARIHAFYSPVSVDLSWAGLRSVGGSDWWLVEAAEFFGYGRKSLICGFVWIC